MLNAAILLVISSVLSSGMAYADTPVANAAAAAETSITEIEAKAAVDGIVCPAEIRNTVAVSGQNTKDWIVGGEEQASLLKGARLFLGPLSMQTIEPFNEITPVPHFNRDRSEFQQIWTFDEKMYQSGIVLVCDYSGNAHFLMRPVANSFKECREINAIERTEASLTRVVCVK